MKRTIALGLGLLLALAAAMPSTAPGPPPEAWSRVHPKLAYLAQAKPVQPVNVIVQKAAGTGRPEQAVYRLGGRVTSAWPFINSFAATLPVGRLGALAATPGIRLITVDAPLVTDSEKDSVDASKLATAYPDAVGATYFWSKGVTGRGVTVAVVDSGFFRHQDFGARVVAVHKSNSDSPSMTDAFGHATHVAGIAAGDGSASGGEYIGVAPRANLVLVKVSDDAGRASERNLVDGLQWVYQNRSKYNIRVVTVSMNSGAASSYTQSAVSAAVEQLWLSGVVVVVSAGNSGPDSARYGPGHDPFVITVGAVHDSGTKKPDDDTLAPWSSYGLTPDGFAKPDVMAPGARIVAPINKNSELAKSRPENMVGEYYFRMGGTSMSAPAISGLAALMLQMRPTLTPNQVKWLLTTYARPYLGQPLGTPGVVDGIAIHRHLDAGLPIGEANLGLTPSPLLEANGTINESNVNWSNVNWSNVNWSNSLDY